MEITVEISKYPLREDFIEPITDFIDRLNMHTAIQVKTFATSTLITGEADTVMGLLTNEIKLSFERYGKVVFVMKVLHGKLGI